MPILTPDSCRDTLYRQQYLRHMNLVKTTTGEVGHITYRDEQYFDLDIGEDEELTFMTRDLSQKKPTLKEKIDWFSNNFIKLLGQPSNSYPR